MILNWKHYSKPIDVWSIGCIFAEIFLRRPLFEGKNHIDQVTTTFSIMGTPTPETLPRIGNEEAQQFVRTLPHMPKGIFPRILLSLFIVLNQTIGYFVH